MDFSKLNLISVVKIRTTRTVAIPKGNKIPERLPESVPVYAARDGSYVVIDLRAAKQSN